MKRSFGTKQRRALVDELQYWNTALKNCLEKLEVPADDENIKVRELQARFNPTHCDALREDVEAFHQALKDGWNCGQPCSHQATIDLDWQSDKPVLPAVFDIALSFHGASTQESAAGYCWRTIQINVEKAALSTVIPSIPSDSSPSSASATSPMSSNHFKKRKLSRLFSQSQNQKSGQTSITASPCDGAYMLAVLNEDGLS